MPQKFDLVGIGNAIVDVIAPTDHNFLSKHDMHPGTMALIDAERAQALTAAMPGARQISGGSAANTCAVAAGLGLSVAFLGKVADDALGDAFATDIALAGVTFPNARLVGGAPTARCLILVTPDGQRTMNTYLGASVAFGEDDVHAETIAEAGIVYLEGYLFDPAPAQAAFHHAARIARQAGSRVALSLSDPFCVDRHRAAFRELLAGIDILFANEAEICSLFEIADFDAAAEAAREAVALAALTRGDQGSLILRGSETIHVPAAPAKVIDTTGAGDAYAAGFLAGLIRGDSLADSGAQASLAAAKVIGHYGARPLN